MKKLIAPLIFICLLASCNKSDIQKPSDKDEPVEKIPEQKEPVKIEMDVPYGTNTLQKMDIWFPDGYNGNTPIVFLAHGGGFFEGDKSGFTEQAKLMMNQGFAVVNFNYRLIEATGLQSKPPLHKKSDIRIAHAVEDAAAAVEKFKEKAASWGLSASKMYMAGHSAGAILSLLYVQGSSNKDKKVRASGNWSGTSNLALTGGDLHVTGPQEYTDYYKELYYRWAGAEPVESNALYFMAISPDWVTSANGGMPNISVMPEFNDDYGVFKIEGSMATIPSVKKYHQMLDQMGIPNSFVWIEKENHSFSNVKESWYEVVKKTADFFKKN